MCTTPTMQAGVSAARAVWRRNCRAFRSMITREIMCGRSIHFRATRSSRLTTRIRVRAVPTTWTWRTSDLHSRKVTRCRSAADWSFGAARFEDGAVGICGRDDKWLGAAGAAVSQAAIVSRAMARGSRGAAVPPFPPERATPTVRYLLGRLPVARVEEHGVEWVHRTTTTDPLVNVAMMWLFAVLGALDAQEQGRS